MATRSVLRTVLQRALLVVFGLAVAAVLLLAAEGVFRLVADEPAYVINVGLPEDLSGITRPDPDLFWSLRPGFAGRVDGVRVEVNSLGLRGPEAGPPREDARRVLCLGESTTFGVGVEQGAEYPRVLERLLRDGAGDADATVLNAGVFAYSSVQSWIWFERHVDGVRPDVVVLYHEVNDYLPSTLRGGHGGVVGALRSDWELHRSSAVRIGRWLESRSRLFRYVQSRVAERRVERFAAEPWSNPLTDVGLPAIGIPPRLYRAEGERGRALVADEAALGRRVTDAEREMILGRFVDACERRGIELVIVHPAYRHSVPHECLLTRFAERRGIELLEADPILHPSGLPRGALFLDSWHPGAEGHRRLAEAIARRL